MSDPGWTVSNHHHSFEDAALAYYTALIDDPDTPMPWWMSALRGDDE